MRLDFCVACGAAHGDGINLEHHHLVPKSKGGTDAASNLITLCHVCHGKAHGMVRHDIRKLTKDALARVKASGKKLGGYRGPMPKETRQAINAGIKAAVKERDKRVAGLMLELHAAGKNHFEIADELNARGMTTVKGLPYGRQTVGIVIRRNAG
jgi:hypothetical protein